MSESKLSAYSSKLSSGFGALQETRDFLRLWTPGMTPKVLVDTAVRQGIFGEATERRIFDQVNDVFAPRYMIQEGRPARLLGLRPAARHDARSRRRHALHQPRPRHWPDADAVERCHDQE